jgi:hypothetical protein
MCSILPSGLCWRPPVRLTDQLAGLSTNWPVLSVGQPAQETEFPFVSPTRYLTGRPDDQLNTALASAQLVGRPSKDFVFPFFFFSKAQTIYKPKESILWQVLPLAENSLTSPIRFPLFPNVTCLLIGVVSSAEGGGATASGAAPRGITGTLRESLAART